ncbi:MAG: acylphosphatase [Actinomycetota bacterium]|nr:acylphosphatase [Actinomycetota bacterium]
MSSAGAKRARVLISGKVQGVFFRFETRDVAQSLGLGGWVRNLPDGSVEAVFEGEGKAVERAIEWCRRGPSLAQVKDVQVNWEKPEGETDFVIRYP